MLLSGLNQTKNKKKVGIKKSVLAMIIYFYTLFLLFNHDSGKEQLFQLFTYRNYMNHKLMNHNGDYLHLYLLALPNSS